MTELVGRAATARRATMRSIRPEQQACLAAWLIHAPGQSPAWAHYLLSLIHLRPIPGADDPMKQFAEAGHEIILAALDPAAGPVPDDQETWYPLRPLNAAVQFGGATDEEALRVLDLAARAVCEGVLPAEPPFPAAGQEMWEQSIQRTAAHVVFGDHREAAG